MAENSPIILAYADGIEKTATNTVYLSNSSSTASASQSGWLSSVPTVLGGETDRSAFAKFGDAIPCTGYTEMYIYPVVDITPAVAETHTCSVYGIYGIKQSGMESPRWLSHKLLDFNATTSTSASPGLSMTSPGGTAYRTYAAISISASPFFSTALDGVVGCQAAAMNGSTTIQGCVGIPHLGGADYVFICIGASTSKIVSNFYVRFG
jgi:hypothetical protein